MADLTPAEVAELRRAADGKTTNLIVPATWANALLDELERRRAQERRVKALLAVWDERADDHAIAGADGVADGLNEALHDLRAALAGGPQ